MYAGDFASWIFCVDDYYECFSLQVCVKECPTENSFGAEVSCDKMACIPGIDPCNNSSLNVSCHCVCVCNLSFVEEKKHW